MNILFTTDGWVVLHFADGTMQTIHTTFNERLLDVYGIHPVDGKFFDIDRLQLIDFRKDAVDIEVFADKPEYDSEVAKFASRFI